MADNELQSKEQGKAGTVHFPLEARVSRKPLRCGHLFNGIGGFQLAAEWAGWQNIWHSEIDEYCNKVAKRNYPNSTCYEDIKETDWTKAEPVDIITGGFPCQPYSTAGKKRGKNDERHLWPQMLEVIKELKPRWIVGENVYGIVNWSDGLVFEEVQAQLEDEGYEVQAYILPAAAVNAPHRRDRVWFVANAEKGRNNRAPQESSEKIRRQNGKATKQFGKRREIRDASDTESKNDGRNFRKQKKGQTQKFGNGIEQKITPNATGKLQQGHESRKRRDSRQKDVQQENGFSNTKQPRAMAKNGNATNSNVNGLEGRKSRRQPERRKESINKQFAGQYQPSAQKWQNFPTESPVCGGNDGLPDRVDRVKALGNAVVPQVALQIFKTINDYEQKYG